MKKSKARVIGDVITDLNAVLGAQTVNIIKAGALLLEARDMVDHGGWLPWLEKNFSLSIRTAANYMAAAKFAAKYDPKFATIANLNACALYWLAGEEDEEVIREVLTQAQDQRVDEDRAIDIANQIQNERQEAQEAETERDAAEAAESWAKARAEAEAKQKAAEAKAEAILDGPPPELPETQPDESQPFAYVGGDYAGQSDFNSSVRTLLPLVTQPSARFATTTFTAEQLQSVAAFLIEVAAAKRPKAAA